MYIKKYMNIIKNVINLTDFSEDNYILNIIEQSKKTRKNILKSNDIDYIVKLLIQDTFIFNTVISCVNFMNYFTKSDNINLWNELENKLIEYNYEFNTDIKLYNKIVELITHIINIKYDNHENKIFLIRLLKSMKKYGLNPNNIDKTKKINNIITKLDKGQKIIYDYISKPLKLKIDKTVILDKNSENILNSVNSSSDSLIITKNTFYYLIKKIANSNIRSNIEQTYVKHSNNILPMLAKIIILRHMYANLLDCDNYSDVINNKDKTETENIKLLLTDLNQKLDYELKHNLLFIKNNSKIKTKLELHDIVYFTNSLLPTVKFSFMQVINLLSFVLNKYFNIDFKLTEEKDDITVKLNSNCIKAYFYRKNKIIANLYINLTDNKQLLIFKLNNYYLEKNVILPNLIMLAGYHSFSDKNLTYNDIISIFREFGNILFIACAITPTSIQEDENELYNLLPNILEYFIYDDEIINLLELNVETINNIKLSKRIEHLFNLKLKCFNALFDNLIHGNAEFINKLKSIGDGNNMSKIITEIYKKAYCEVFNNISDVYNTDIKYINPIIIQNCINGNQCIVYGSVLSSILAYNIYNILKQKNNTNFVDLILQNSNNNYKKNIQSFLDNNIKEDYYINFLKTYLKLDLNINNFCETENNDDNNDVETIY